MPRHDLACCGMSWKSCFWTTLACCGMNWACCGMPASGFWLKDLMLRHALVLCPFSLLLTLFCYSLLVLWSFHLNITYKINTNIKMSKTGDKQYKTLRVRLFHWKWLTGKCFQHFRVFVSRKISGQRKIFSWSTENQAIFL